MPFAMNLSARSKKAESRLRRSDALRPRRRYIHRSRNHGRVEPCRPLHGTTGPIHHLLLHLHSDLFAVHVDGAGSFAAALVACRSTRVVPCDTPHFQSFVETIARMPPHAAEERAGRGARPGMTEPAIHTGRAYHNGALRPGHRLLG